MTANALDAIVLLGDSITQGGWEAGGFSQQLAYKYARRLDVINRGLSGYNTEWSIGVFEQMLSKAAVAHLYPKMQLLIIWFGANDSVLKHSPQYVPIDKFKANLEHLIAMVHDSTSEYYSPQTRVLLLTPPPIGEAQRNADLASRNPPLKPDREWNNSKAYADAVVEIGKGKPRVEVVDIWEAIWAAAGEDVARLPEFLSDGLHLTVAGYQITFQAIMKAIDSTFPEIHYDRLPLVFPAWGEIDWKDPRPSLHSRRKEEL